jgi:molecular chaperone GrpE (heat shock protein)
MRKPRTKPKRPQFPDRPPAPEQLLAALQAIFPTFESQDLRENLQDDLRPPSGKLHCILRDFMNFFSSAQNEISEHQLKSLSHLINEAVAVVDLLETAIATCMLEHLRQIEAYKALSPYLSPKAKERTHA